LCQPNLSLAELPDDLLRRELLPSCHLSTSLGLQPPEILSLEVATFKGGRSPHLRPQGGRPEMKVAFRRSVPTKDVVD
jgi:hypothetical protein